MLLAAAPLAADGRADLRAPIARVAPGLAPALGRVTLAAAVPGTYANGADTLRLVAAPGGGLRYRYRTDDPPARYEAASGELHVLDAQGRTRQEFGFVRGTARGRWYLHDGLSAFARLRRAGILSGEGSARPGKSGNGMKGRLNGFGPIRPFMLIPPFPTRAEGRPSGDA